MSVNEKEYLGYLQYSGESVKEGFLDARKSAQALLGFDDAIRFFVGREEPSLREIDYEIPVRIEKGSWQALIPQSIGEWVMTAAGIAATAYIATAAREIAKKDFEDKGIRDVFRKALCGIQWVIKIGRHLKNMNVKELVNLKWRKNNTEVGIPNEKGEYLFVPNKFCKAYEECPHALFSKICEIIEAERKMQISVFVEGKWQDVTLGDKEKRIFFTQKDDDTMLFPELKDGQIVELEGVVTRGNENTNALGVEYKGHILTCHPRKGSVVRFKPGLFVKCRIQGTISRKDKLGEHSEARPRIIVDDVRPLKSGNTERSLFSEK